MRCGCSKLSAHATGCMRTSASTRWAVRGREHAGSVRQPPSESLQRSRKRCLTAVATDTQAHILVWGGMPSASSLEVQHARKPVNLCPCSIGVTMVCTAGGAAGTSPRMNCSVSARRAHTPLTPRTGAARTGTAHAVPAGPSTGEQLTGAPSVPWATPAAGAAARPAGACWASCPQRPPLARGEARTEPGTLHAAAAPAVGSACAASRSATSASPHVSGPTAKSGGGAPPRGRASPTDAAAATGASACARTAPPTAIGWAGEGPGSPAVCAATGARKLCRLAMRLGLSGPPGGVGSGDAPAGAPPRAPGPGAPASEPAPGSAGARGASGSSREATLCTEGSASAASAGGVTAASISRRAAPPGARASGRGARAAASRAA